MLDSGLPLFFSRANNGGTISIEPYMMNLLRIITGCTNNEDVMTVLRTLDQMKISQVPLKIPVTIYPGKNEYQNFGILPALDHIFAINDLFKGIRKSLKRFMPSAVLTEDISPISFQRWRLAR